MSDMTHELMQQIIATWSDQKPNTQYRLVPNDGWYTLDGEPVQHFPYRETDLEPHAEYCVVRENTIWRLYRDTERRQHLLCRMVVDLETDTIVWSFWALPSDELAALTLKFIVAKDSHL
jgi:hypothetical protein